MPKDFSSLNITCGKWAVYSNDLNAYSGERSFCDILVPHERVFIKWFSDPDKAQDEADMWNKVAAGFDVAKAKESQVHQVVKVFWSKDSEQVSHQVYEPPPFTGNKYVMERTQRRDDVQANAQARR